MTHTIDDYAHGSNDQADFVFGVVDTVRKTALSARRNGLMIEHQRPGQWCYNTLSTLCGLAATIHNGTLRDCFYQDDKIEKFCDAVLDTYMKVVLS